jgi:ABC-type multidrug transport system fused ATPase/permease subunit
MKSSLIGRIASNMPGIIVFALGGWLVLNGKTTIGVVFALNASMGYLRYNTYMSMQGFTVWKKTAASAVRIFDLWDKKTEDETWENIDKDISHNNPKDHSVFTFNNVSFSYSDNIDDKDEEKLKEKQKEAHVLKNISFSINKGETIAFVGRSGCGKTTLLKLMAGFYKAGCGRITKNGIDIRDLELDEIRNDMAMVSQDAFLFPVTIHNNILYGTGAGVNESDGNNYIEPGDEVIHAAKLARIHSFIEAQPKKYESLVGERGIKLSGGQRQRLSIARAIIKNADILLLDEPTSALDTDAEHKVHTALNKLMENKTSIIAAHRLSGIKNADRIYVMDSGEIIEAGTHKELIEGKGLYYELYHRQMKETQVGINEECG